MSIVNNSPFDSDDDLFPNGDNYFPSHSDGETHDWESQHHDSDHNNDDHLHTLDSDHHDSYFSNDLIHQADDWHLQTPDSDEAHSTMLGDADDHTGYWVHQNFDPTHPDGIVVGDPGHDMECWHPQNHPDDCAVVAQQSILESLTGKYSSEDGLCREALADGCYYPGGGTPADHVGHLLEEHGIPVQQHYGGTLSDLNDRLSHGEKVIVAVNSQEIWSPDQGSILSQTLGQYPGIPGQKADHAVVVTGIVYPQSDPLHPQVVLNDSGTYGGKGMMVPLEQFEKAWASSDHYMVSTALHEGNYISHNDDTTLNTTEPELHDDSTNFILGYSNISVSNDGYVYRNGTEVGYFNGWTLVNSKGNIGYYNCGSRGIYNSSGDVVGSMDEFGNVYRTSNAFPILTNCKSFRTAAAYVLVG